MSQIIVVRGLGPILLLAAGLFIQTFRAERARGCVRNQLSICWTVRKEKGRREEEKGTRFGG